MAAAMSGAASSTNLSVGLTPKKETEGRGVTWFGGDRGDPVSSIAYRVVGCAGITEPEKSVGAVTKGDKRTEAEKIALEFVCMLGKAFFGSDKRQEVINQINRSDVFLFFTFEYIKVLIEILNGKEVNKDEIENMFTPPTGRSVKITEALWRCIQGIFMDKKEDFEKYYLVLPDNVKKLIDIFNSKKHLLRVSKIL